MTKITLNVNAMYSGLRRLPRKELQLQNPADSDHLGETQNYDQDV